MDRRPFPEDPSTPEHHPLQHHPSQGLPSAAQQQQQQQQQRLPYPQPQSLPQPPPQPPLHHQQYQQQRHYGPRFDPYDSHHSAADKYAAVTWQQQYGHPQHQQQHDRRPADRMDLGVHTASRNPGLYPLAKRPLPSADLDDDPDHARSLHYTSYAEAQSQDDARRGFPPALSLPLHTHRPSPPPRHHPFASSSSNSTVLVGREREGEGGREPENKSSGGRGPPGQHPEESLHPLSSMAYQQQQWRQHHRSPPASPARSVDPRPHGAAGFAWTTSGEDCSLRHAPPPAQDRAPPPSHFEIKDFPRPDAADRARDRDRPSSTFSATPYSSQHDDHGGRYSASYESSQHPYRPRLDPAHDHADSYYYEDLHSEQEDNQGVDQKSVPYPYQSQYRPAHQHSSRQPQREPYSTPPASSSPYSRYMSSSSHTLSQPQQRQPTLEQAQQQERARRRSNVHPSGIPSRPSLSSVPPRGGYHDHIGDGNSTTHDSSYDSNAEDDEGTLLSRIRDQDVRFKFGTGMPNTVDLRSAIESCDVLCRFALHYSGHTGALHDDGHGLLDPEMRVNLQKIQSMNTTMLIGLQNMPRQGGKSGNAGAGIEERFESEPSQQGRTDRERSPPRFGYGPPSNEMVHELAKVATSIFQLAIRIKAWVSMTPEERELDEEINTIRGRRCLLMDSALAAAKVDPHGNVQNGWTVVPAASSTSKTFYERQRDLDQHRSSNSHLQNLKHSQQQQQQQQHPQNYTNDKILAELDRNKMDVDNERPPYRRVGSNSALASLATAPPGYGFNDPTSSLFTPDTNMPKGGHDYMKYHSKSGGGGLDTDSGRNSRNDDTPYQKYRKRAKRTQPPGRCLSCDSSDTPEWRRGPDGARTLCNACGLHYAKLLKRQSENSVQQQLLSGPPPFKSRATASRIEQLQTPAFPLRRRNGSQSLEPPTPSGPRVTGPPSTSGSVSSGSSEAGSYSEQGKKLIESPTTSPDSETPDSQQVSQLQPTPLLKPLTDKG